MVKVTVIRRREGFERTGHLDGGSSSPAAEGRHILQLPAVIGAEGIQKDTNSFRGEPRPHRAKGERCVDIGGLRHQQPFLSIAYGDPGVCDVVVE